MHATNKRSPYAFVSYMCVGRDPLDWVGDGIIEYAPLEYAEIFIERNLIFGMTERMADFICSNCKCAFCSKPVPHNLEICDCGKQDSRIAEVSYPLHSLHQTVMSLAEVEAAEDYLLRKQINRKNKSQANGGKHTATDIAKLFSLQDGNCYYCGSTLTNTNGGENFHVDHFISLTYQGTNDFQNLVLACPSCNIEKAMTEGKIFIKQKMIQLDEENQKRAITAQTQVTQHKKKLRATLARNVRKSKLDRN